MLVYYQHMTVACQTIREAVDLLRGFLEDGEVKHGRHFREELAKEKALLGGRMERLCYEGGSSILRSKTSRQGNGNTGLRDAMPAASGSQSSLPLRLSNWCS